MNILNSKTIDKGNTPKDIVMIRKMFDSLGIEEYEKNTLNYMSEFINSYIIDILKESKKNMTLSNRDKINIEDVELAIKTKQNFMYQNRPTVSQMQNLAESVNKIPLPMIPDTPNILMPPVENNLLRNNFQIYSEELNKIVNDENNKNIFNSTTMRPDDFNNILGNKRKNNFSDSKNNILNYEGNKLMGALKKKHRKLSLSQAFKKTSQANSQKNNNESSNNAKDEDDEENVFDEDYGGDDDGEEMDNDDMDNNEKEDEKNNNNDYEDKFESIHGGDENDEEDFGPI